MSYSHSDAFLSDTLLEERSTLLTMSVLQIIWRKRVPP